MRGKQPHCRTHWLNNSWRYDKYWTQNNTSTLLSLAKGTKMKTIGFIANLNHDMARKESCYSLKESFIFNFMQKLNLSSIQGPKYICSYKTVTYLLTEIFLNHVYRSLKALAMSPTLHLQTPMLLIYTYHNQSINIYTQSDYQICI